MLVAALPWSILPHHHVWGAVMRIKAWFDKNEYWLRWVRWIVFPLLGMLAAIWIAAADAYKKVDAIPELTEQVERLSKSVQALGDSIRGELRKAEDRQGSQLFTHVQEEKAARDGFGNSLKAVQAELIAVKTKVDGKIDAQDVRRLISKVEEVTATEAGYLSIASVSGKPQIPNAVLTAYKGREVVYAMNMGNSAQSLKILMFAKGSYWEPFERGLKVKFDGGEAIFAAKPSASKVDLARQVDLFNSLSHSAGSVGGPWTVPSTKDKGVMKLPGQLPGGQVTPQGNEMRAPPFTDKLRN